MKFFKLLVEIMFIILKDNEYYFELDSLVALINVIIAGYEPKQR